MLIRTALNTELIMKGVTRRRQAQTQNSSSTPPTTRTDMGSNITAPHNTNTQASHTLSDVLGRLEYELNQFQYPVQTPKARAATLATVDQDIDAVKRLMLSMLTRHNMLVPISILPAEILARIFHFTAFQEQPYSLGWVRVTHVCQRWRQIALDDSTLWTHFSTFPRNKNWITERLSRTRNAPLVIELELDGPIGEDMFSLFRPHISHTRELHLRNMSRNLYSAIIQGLRTQKAPILEHLELSIASASPISMKRSDVHSFFNGPLPKLRIFCISQILFPWSFIPRGLLTQLKITYNEEVSTVPSKVSQHDDWKQLIGLLVGCPALEVLTLENCLPAMLSTSSCGQTVHLPLLSRLCLRGSSFRITNLLRMLKLSSSTTLCLNCMPEFGTTHSDHPIFPILLAHFNHHPVKFRSFMINLSHMSGVIDMTASTSLPISPIPHAHVIQENNNAEFSLSFHGVVEPNHKADLLRRTCDVLSLSNVEFLSMHSLSPNQFLDWSKIFQHCTEVTTVQVYGHGTIGLLQALTPPPQRTKATARGKGRKRKGSDNRRGSRAQGPYDVDNHVPQTVPIDMPIFPKLTSLLLETLDFADAVPGSGVLYDLVLSAVQRRKANKMPLTTLCIDHCAIREKQAKALEKIVGDFRWDHDEDNYYYYDSDFDDYGYGSDYGDDFWDINDPSLWEQAAWDHGW